MDIKDQKISLIAFATPMEFSKVFPEDYSESKDCLVPLKGAFQGFYGCVLGVGLLEFSASLSHLIFECKQNNLTIESVTNVGICGAYPHQGLSLSQVVCVEKECVGDLGYEEPNGSKKIWSHFYEAAKLEDAPIPLKKILLKLPKVKGCSVNLSTGTSTLAKERLQLNCQVESMEGAACFAVCEKFKIPAYEIRGVSNISTQRDKSSWKISEALDNLRKIFY